MPQKEALLKLQFNSVIVEQLWESTEHYFCSYFQKKDETIILQKGNDTYLKLYNISDEEIGKTMRQSRCNQETHQIFMLFRQYKYYEEYSGDYMNYIRELVYEGELTFWDVSVIIQYPYIHCVGKLLKHPNVRCMQNSTYDFGCFKLGNKFTGSILLELTEDGKYVIQSCSDDITKLEDSLKIGNNIQEKIQGLLYSRKTSEIFDECINMKCPIQYFDILDNKEERDGGETSLESSVKIVHFIIIPILHQSFTGTFIMVTVLNNEDSQLNGWSEQFSKNIYESDLFGSFMINCINQKYPYITEMNSYFVKQLYEEKLDINTILNSSILEKVRNSMVAASGSISFTQKDESKKCYSINIIPSIRNNMIERMLVTIIPEQEVEHANHVMLSMLTNREKEVIDLVVQGDTNRYIAQKLKITEGTVKKMIYNCYQKLRINSRIELVKLLISK